MSRLLRTYIVALCALVASLPATAQVPGHGCVANCYLDSNFDAGTGASPSTFWRGDGTWATPPGETPSYYLSGNWYVPIGTGAQIVAGTSLSTNTIYCVYGGVSTNVTIKALGVDNTAGTTGNVQFAVYSSSGGTLTLIDSTANVANAAGAVSQTVANTTDNLTAGTRYAFCLNTSASVQNEQQNSGQNEQQKRRFR